MQQIPSEPAITKEEVREQFLKHLDFQLAWHHDLESDGESYFLAYEACDSQTRTSILSVDAMTGEVNTYQDPF